MKIDGKTITLDASLWAQYDNVAVKTAGDKIVLVGQDEASYLKIFNHFGRVLTLLVFEGEQWVEAGSGAPVRHVDLSQAGRVAAASPNAKPVKGGAAKSGAKRKAPVGSKTAAKGGSAKSGATGKAKPATARSASGKAKAKPASSAKAASSATGEATSAPSGKAKPKRPAVGKRGGATSAKGTAKS